MNAKLFHKISRFMVAGLTYFAVGAASAQSQHDYRRSADKFYAEGDYYSAVTYYQKYLEAGSKNSTTGFRPYSATTTPGKAGKSVSTREESYFRIAESFRLLHDHVNAEKWYEKCLDLNADQYPLVRFWYAMSLRANGKYDEAIEQLTLFSASYKNKDDYASRAALELENCRFVKDQLQKKGVK